MIKYVTRILLYVFIIAGAISVSAQSRQGNLVEYFGKEKVEEINEGAVKHVFKEGLILKIRSFGFNSSSTPKNPVYSKFLLEEPKEIKAGDPFIEDDSGNMLKWEKIEVGEKNEFSDRALRSGYLYLEFNSKKEENVIFEASKLSAVAIIS